MNFFDIFFIAIGLAMDAFAISVTNGMTVKNFGIKQAVQIGVCFGGFQFAMPVIGFLLGQTFKDYVQAVQGYIAFGLLGFIGGKMIFDTVREQKKGGEENPSSEKTEKIALSVLLVQGVATSIDALATGVVFATGNVPIIPAAGLIGIVSFVLPFCGGFIGKAVGKALGKWSQLAGGIVLIAIGTKILVESFIK